MTDLRIGSTSPFAESSVSSVNASGSIWYPWERALEIANDVPGVKSVTYYLLRKREEDTCGWTDNLEIGAKIKAELIGDRDISSTRVDVKAIQCHVVLLGILGSKEEVAKVIAHAKSVAGVRGVTSYLKAAN